MGTSSGPGESGTLPGGGALCIESTKEATSSPDKSGARQEVVVQQREADVRDGGRRGLGKVIWDSQKGEVRKKR